MARFECNVQGCDFTCRWEFDLKRHKNEKHTERVKDKTCEYCGFKTFTMKLLKRHQKSKRCKKVREMQEDE